jgi:hypothetical protein
MPHDTGETPALLWGQCREAFLMAAGPIVASICKFFVSLLIVSVELFGGAAAEFNHSTQAK